MLLEMRAHTLGLNPEHSISQRVSVLSHLITALMA